MRSPHSPQRKRPCNAELNSDCESLIVGITVTSDARGQLAGDPYLRARYAMAARKLVIERFTANIIGRQSVALYNRVIRKTLDTDYSLLL